MTAFLALFKKDLVLFFLDRRAVIMSFLAPILIGSFFGYVFSGAAGGGDRGRIAVLVTDLDGGPASREIIAKMKADKSIEVRAVPLEEAKQLVRKGSAPVAVEIPKDFGKQATRALFMPGEKPKLHFYIDPSHWAESSMVKGILTGHVMQAVSKEAFGGASGRTLAADTLKSLDAATGMPAGQRDALRTVLQGVARLDANEGGGNTVGGLSIPFDTSEEALTAKSNAPYNSYGHSFAGMAVQFILFMGIDVGMGLLLQRQRGLWKRFRAAPVSKAQLLGSRALSAAVIAVVIMSVVFTFARIVFGVNITGSLAGFFAVTAAFGMMTAAYGLMIAALGKTPEAARGLSVLGTILMVMLSGAWMPSFLFPAWLQSATKLVPARWAMDGLDAMIWRGLGFGDAVLPAAVLVGFALLFGTIAVMRFRWETE